MADTTFPSLSDFRITQVIDRDGPVGPISVELSATDSDSGIKEAVIVFDRPFGVSYEIGGRSSVSNVLYVRGTESWPNGTVDTFADGRAQENFTVSSFGYDGRYTIQLIVVEDNAGNRAGTNTAQLAALNYPTYIDILSNTYRPTEGADFLLGNTSRDRFLGLGGNDRISGLWGGDTISGNTGSDTLMGNEGADLLYGGLDGDAVYGGQGADLIFGNFGGDLLLGNLGDDTLYGGQGDDTIHGGQGNDTINGNLGNDVLAGNRGADRFVFNANSGVDLVRGFAVTDGDRLDLQGQTWTLDAATDGSAVLRVSGGGTIALEGVAAGSVNSTFFA